ncbi:hypothetical protein SAMD00019534_025550 [Acytostelium subglobosum LB1]|uniref:hypothetical protein n=1 Tax=Acytostelium subglobosum LB1 TaxID=1410327 RepID=UPI000644E742|nr:hypothetical protein SAMD00019534_025550 [Acytostelium subglobosum LB1]GAM19380.1 hypothetical protein SAMD00019534_025550 [Acytostelium subglobosum LB1]|eukprot:XP_012757307.1 hypothetical protein SAMD00019534_025550 [Acytostelium subglobosum LB1]
MRDGWFDENLETFVKTMRDYKTMSPYCTDAMDISIGVMPNRPHKVLDLGCGAGALSIQAASRLAPIGGSVTSIDSSRRMLELLELERSSMKLENLDTVLMDGEFLQFEHDTFTIVYSAFSLVFFSDREKIVKEMLRVLTPGGKCVITSFPYNNEVFNIFEEAIFRLTKIHPSETIRQVVSLGDGIDIKRMMRDCGFTNATVHTTSHQWLMPIDVFLNFFRFNPIFKTFQSYLPECYQSNFVTMCREIIEEIFPDGTLDLKITCVIGLGEKPKTNGQVALNPHS